MKKIRSVQRIQAWRHICTACILLGLCSKQNHCWIVIITVIITIIVIIIIINIIIVIIIIIIIIITTTIINT